MDTSASVWCSLALCLLSCAGVERREESSKQELSIEWIFGPGPQEVASVPQVQWCSDGAALIYDGRLPAEQRTIERLDPVTNERTPLVDSKAAVANLKELLKDAAPTSLPWPSEIARTGRRVLYSWQDDLFVLDLPGSTFRRLTQTADVEKAARFSPDGAKLAFVRNNDLFVIELSSGVETRLTQDGSKTILNGTLSWVYWEELYGRQDIGYWWSPDSSSIAYLQSDESSVDLIVFPHFTPEVPGVIEQRYPKAGRPNPKVRAGVVSIDPPETRWLSPEHKDFEYLARVEWLPDSRRLALQTMSRDQRILMLHIADRLSGTCQRLLTETDAAWVNVHDDLYFFEDGSRFLWMSERSGFAHLYLYNLDGTFVCQVTDGPWATRSSGGGVFWMRQAIAGVDESGGWVYFGALEKSSLENHLYRVKLDGSGFERLTSGDGKHSITMRRDGALYFDAFSNVSTLPELSLCCVSDGKRTVIAPSRPDLLADFALCGPEQFTIPAEDGFALPAQIWKPKDFDPRRRYPLILHIYGGPSAPEVQNVWHAKTYFNNILLQHGFLVAQVDNRSATAISKKLENKVHLEMSGDSELNDLVCAVRWFKKQSYVDPGRVGIWGWSNGGSVTLLCMSRSPEFKAGISVAPVTNWAYYDTKWAETGMKTPAENPEGYAKTNFCLRAKDLHGRLLLAHGTYDDNVHPQNSWHFIDELIKAGKNFDMLWFPMRGHGINDPPARIHLYKKMLEFWTAHL